MEYTQIKYKICDRILTITLDRPEKLNAFTDQVMAPELLDALNKADEDDNVRVIVVTGAGRGFCSGHDLSEGGGSFDYSEQGHTLESHRDPGGFVTLRIYDMKKPLIAAINGAAVGVGITMTLPMDIRLASENAKFGFVFAKVGITLEACSGWFLPRVVCFSKAAEWSYTGRIFDAREAFEGGLVSQVLPSDALMDRAYQIASEIANNTSAVSVALNRQLLWKMLGADHPMESHKIESKCIYVLGKGVDGREGGLSFFEKRSPRFTMKPSSDMPVFYPWWQERKFK